MLSLLPSLQDQRSKDYDTMSVAYRPSHADATYDAKYGIRAIAGGGRSSARETIGRVAAAAVARKVGGELSQECREKCCYSRSDGVLGAVVSAFLSGTVRMGVSRPWGWWALDRRQTTEVSLAMNHVRSANLVRDPFSPAG